uniref:Uncharacterized protein n=1 Tax=viral metagenome TaxID=1070528 RepID=A0A6C0FDB8_9ZZZZ
MSNLYDSDKTSRYIFLYNSFAHITLAALYAYRVRDKLLLIFSDPIGWDSEFGRAAYIFGHFLISCAQYTLYQQNIDDSAKVTSLGSLGHAMILVYIAWVTYYFKLSTGLFVFMLAQFGMIYFYINHMDDQTVVYAKKDTRIKKRDIFLGIFSVLFFYYVYAAMYQKGVYRYGMGLVAGVYANLIYHFITQV